MDFTEIDIIAFVSGLDGVVVFTPTAADGAPEISWGDTFVYHDPDGDPQAGRRMPFATIVTKDYDGFDTVSNLNRPGVFRLNIAVGREGFEKLVGYPPAAHAGRAAHFDYAVLDRFLPHPVYATQSWVCVLNPGQASAAQARSLLADAHARAAQRHRRRASE
ncbi:MAG TPA: DUF6194 family protein [Amycolatopsis sp.]|uniref:DUF6194 family protein n=1 Tax=Amycolatopsis sp. TaxID=37632 RepID=UPI002B4911FB|nr:DUF6194 family protein [Amycolatopsis sp.]HKS45006.1 DUF6194 family protein [Amycolatopsis sp.]